MISGVRASAALLGACLTLTSLLSGCGTDSTRLQGAGSPTPVASGPGTTDPTLATPAPEEPTSTNTLPPPPPPTAPAPSTAGPLDERALPVPSGWRRAVLEGGEEDGFEGNGTWVHARDPRYAARDAIAVGCADVNRDDYRDPTAALEGNYTSTSGAPGIGLVMQFADEEAAARYFTLYRRQVEACTAADQPVTTEIVSADGGGLIDRRTYPDSEWTEIVGRSADRVTLVILGDAGHKITARAARAVLAQIV